MMRWILIGIVLKRVAQLLAVGLVLLTLGAGVAETTTLFEDWPERVPQLLEKLLNPGYDFGFRRAIGLGR